MVRLASFTIRSHGVVLAGSQLNGRLPFFRRADGHSRRLKVDRRNPIVSLFGILGREFSICLFHWPFSLPLLDELVEIEAVVLAVIVRVAAWQGPPDIGAMLVVLDPIRRSFELVFGDLKPLTYLASLSTNHRIYDRRVRPAALNQLGRAVFRLNGIVGL